MDQLVACPDCGTPNRPDADLCVQCWRGMSEEVASKIPVAAFAAVTQAAPRTLRSAPLPPPPRPSVAPLRPVVDRPVGEAAPGAVPYFAPVSQPVPSTGIPQDAVPDAAATPRRRGEVKWRWAHLWAVGICAWGLPETLTKMWAPRFEGRGILDAALAIQIGGYILAALVVAVLVSRVHGGDWSTVGIRWSEKAYDDAFRGAGFGLLLIGIFFGVTFALSGGELEVDGLVKMLIGGTSGPGFFLAAAVVVVGAPVIEEIYYRGMLYEKFARWGRWPAIIGTSILFVLAHGALIIPALLLLAFGVGWKRQTKSLWYTMGAHAGWNLVVLCLGIFVMSGPAEAFSPPDRAYTLRYAADWTVAGAEIIPGPVSGLDLVLVMPTGSVMTVTRDEMPPGVYRGNIKGLARMASSSVPMPSGMQTNGVRDSDLVGGGLVSAYETSVVLHDPVMGSGKGRILTILRDGSSEAVTLAVVCPDAECPSVERDFEEMARSFQFTS